jgi:hypothetical protein
MVGLTVGGGVAGAPPVVGGARGAGHRRSGRKSHVTRERRGRSQSPLEDA